MPDFVLPDLGEGLGEAEVLAWRVEVGDTVYVDQIVVEVETAKAAVEVPIPFAGTVSALHARAGQTVRVGAALISVAEAAEGFRERGVHSAPPAGTSADAGSGNVLIGYGTPATTRRRRPTRRPTPAGRPGPDRPAALAVADVRAADRPVPVISPLVRKMARDARIDLRTIRSSGPAGLVLRRDVEQAMAEPAPATGAHTDEDERRVPLVGVRKHVADKMSRSRREIPEATVWVDVDATGLLAARAALNAADPARPVSPLALLGRFAVLGLRRHPELNARVEPDEVVLHAGVGLGFAAQTDRGLVVPVVRNAHRLTTRELSAEITRLTEGARAGALTPAELTGGTFTINNYGVFGVDGSAAIINYPEVAILGIGRIVDKPWVVDGALAVRKVCQLTLAFDHRACDGGIAGGFLRFIADCVEAPITALGEL